MFSKLSTALVLALAVVGEASRHRYGHHAHHRRALNTTSTAIATDPTTQLMTTSTVYTTQEYTITTCAPTVKDCPAESKTEVTVVTATTAAYTTVCPVTTTEVPTSIIPSETASASSSAAASVYSSASEIAPVSSSAAATVQSSIVEIAPATSSAAAITSSPAVPLSTGSPGSSSAAAGTDYTTSMFVSNSTLTYTLGSGSSTTVVTTTVQRTSTRTVYQVSLNPRNPQRFKF